MAWYSTAGAHVSAVASAVALALLAGAAVTPAWAAPAPEPWTLWDRAADQRSAAVDHEAWQRFLDTYLVAHPDGINRVAYRRVSSEDARALQRYLDSLAGLDPRTYTRAEQLAYWINLYNALTVRVVLDHPNKRSILRMGKGFLSVGPWDDPLIRIAGQEVTLNDIEHRILRPLWRDHRIHYAVNCASISCPNLAAEAYTRENSERLLTAGERDYVNHPRGVRFDARGRLVLSKIYRWYRDDFAADTAGLLAYLGQHHGTHKLSDYPGRIRYDYDWALNAVE